MLRLSIASGGLTQSAHQNDRSPGVGRVIFTPHTCCIYTVTVWITLDFGHLRFLIHDDTASYAVPVRQARVLPTTSFPRHLAMIQLLFS